MIDQEPDFWLGERSEYLVTDFDGRLRRCYILGRLTSAADATAEAPDRPPSTLLWVRLDPPLILDEGQFDEVVVQARHVGKDVDHLGDESTSIYVAAIRSKEGFEHGRVEPSSLHLLAWADVARHPSLLPPTQEEGFDRVFEILRAYAEREGDANVPPEHREGSLPLGNWVHSIKRSQAQGDLRADWAHRLASLPAWRWGVDAERDWSFWADEGSMWLMPVTGADTIALDRRLRYCDPVRGGGPIVHADGRAAQWVEIYPPLRLDTDERVMLLIVPGVELSATNPGPITVELSQVLGWQLRPGGAREADRTRNIGPAVVAADPALLPPMTDEEWDAGLDTLGRYRDEIGHCWVPFDHVPTGDHTSVTHLGGWALRVRSEHRRGLLRPERTRQVESVPDWQWSR